MSGLADDISLTQVNTEDAERDTVWKIDTSIPDNKVLQDELSKKFQDNGESLFVSHTVKFDPPQAMGSAPAVDAGANTNETPKFTIPSAEDLKTSAGDSSIGEVTAESEVTEATETEDATEAPEASETEASDTPDTEAAETESANGDEATEPAATDGSRLDLPSENLLAQAGDELRLAQADAAAGFQAAPPATSGSKTTLEFEQRVTRDTLIDSLRTATEATGLAEPSWGLTGPNGEADSAAGFRSWNVEANTSPENLGQILGKMKENFESKPAWLSSSKIGGKVAGDTKNKALAAILISLVCIVGYLWIRFQRVIFGLSAVVALVHDVLITLGAIALSAYLANVFGFLLIDEFKISLPVVAAFLTIIGYSLNDTIVVFDRIREVRGRSPDITEDMINTSINQTLSRTVLTSLTTLIVVLILYLFGGQGIHGFAFALLVGVVVGTYSSIFVASPALLWMSEWQDDSSPSAKRQTAKAS